MKSKNLYTLLTISVILVFIFSLFSTVNVLADDDTPPAPTEESAQPPTEEPGPTEVPTQEPTTQEDVNVGEILAQVPGGTDLVVLDENGNPLPMASQKASEIVANSDPQFCPTGQLPVFMSGTCTGGGAIQSSIALALADAQSIGGNGTIWVEVGTFTENVTVDGSGWSTTTPTTFGIIGAGSGSTFLDGYFEIINMYAFTLSGFTIEDPGSGGGYVYAQDNTGTLTLNDLVVTNPTGNGIDVVNQVGDVNLASVDSNNNSGDGADIDTHGALIVESSEFNNNTSGSGLNAVAHHNITLTDVTANGNRDNGAFLDNSCGCATGNVFVSNSNFDLNTSSGEDVGLYIDSNGSVTLSGVSASDNFAGDGSDIYDFSSLSIQDSVFNDNHSTAYDFGYGLFIGTNTGDVTLVNVEASGNNIRPFDFTAAGAYIDTLGKVTVTGARFNNNDTAVCGCGADGLDIYNANTATLTDVTANWNTWDGVYTYNVDTVSVTGGYFNNNGNLFGSGLDLDTPLVVTLRNIQANGNVGSGAYIGSASPMDISIICSEFSGNSEYGLEVEGDGQVVLDRVTFFDNGLGDYFIDTATVSIFSNGNCNPEHTKKKIVDGSSLPLKIVNVTGGQSVELDCEHFGGTKLMLENGNSITLPCPIIDSASIIDNNKIEDLPKPLPEGNTFLSAFTTSASKKGEKLDKLGSFATISFVIPEGVEASKLAILFWKGTEWTDVKNTYVRNDPVTGDSYFEAFVNETGTFVLVQK